MKRKSVHQLFICLLLAYLTFSQPSSSSADPVSISYVSTTNSLTSSLVGSLNGGTTIYIHGLGFDPTDSNNAVFVGMNYCNTSKGGVSAGGDTIACDTTAPAPGTSLTNLPITIVVTGKSSYTCTSSSCKFSYTSSQTPLLYNIYPRSGTGYSFIKFYGIHRIVNLGGATGSGLDMGDVKGFYFGKTLCSRFDISEPDISPNSLNYITCMVSPVQEGGYYNVTEWVVPGIATNTYRMNYGSILKGINYQFIAIPTISSLSSNSGGSQGLTLTITGTGFSSNSSKISVTAANNPCNIISSSQTSITCTVQPDINGNTYGKLQYTGTAINQKNGYISGTGLFYQRWDLSDIADGLNIANFISKVSSNDPSIVLLESGIKNELETPNIYGSNYGQVFKGYFKAPTTGNYIFRALADDYISVYLSNTKSSTQSTGINYNQPLITSDSYSSSSRNYYLGNNPTLTSFPVTMTAGDVYYMQVYHINGYGGGFCMVSVQVPNTNIALANQRPQVHMFNSSATVDPEIVSWQSSATSGTINFRLIIKNPKTLVVTYDVNATGNYDMSASDFASLLDNFNIFSNYKYTVTRTTLDLSKNPTTDPALIKYYNWTVSISTYRSTTDSSLTPTFIIKISQSGASVTFSAIQNHSPPIAGTFQLSINDTQITYWSSALNAYAPDLPFNIPAATLAYYIQSTLGYPFIQVELIPNQAFVDGVTWIVTYVGVKSQLSTPVINTNALTGGRAGTLPTITFQQLRSYSSNLLVEPITSEYLFTYAMNPQVIVTVGDVISQCTDTCTYTVLSAKTPTLNSVTLSGKTLTLSVTDPTNTATMNSLIVTMDNQNCVIQSGGSLSSFTCLLPTNSDNTTPLLRAGSYLPIVQLINIGIAKPANGLVNLDIPLTITDATPVNSAQTGGLPITISGSGFPESLSQTFTIQMCGFNVQILSISNIQISIVSRACVSTSSSINITYNGISSGIAYTYTASQFHSITSVSPTSASPVLKGTLNITGTNFGADTNSLKVYLVNSTTGARVYRLNILSATDTFIQAFLGGGLPGKFNVLVYKSAIGYSIAANVNSNNFTYELVVTNVAVNTGSIGGGTIITVTGKNFSPNKIDNQVYIGDTVNWLCVPITVSTTEIVCQTPPYDLSGQYSQIVTVVGKVIIDSSCPDTSKCTFTYKTAANSPNLAVITTTTFKAGDIVTLDGNNLINNGVNPTVTVGGISAAVIAANTTNTKVQFIFPALANGTYQVLVYVDGIGWAYPAPYVSTLFSFVQLIPTSGSTAGNIVTMKGNGFVNTSDVKFKFSITATSGTVNYNILQITPTTIKVQLLGGADGVNYTFSNTYGTTTITAKYQCQSVYTPTIKLVSPDSIAYNGVSQQIIFTRSSVSDSPSTISALPVNSDGVIVGSQIPLSIIDINEFNANMTVDASALAAGNYTFRAYFDPNGYAIPTGYLQILKSSYTVNQVTSSYYGGQFFNVSGTGLNPNSILDIAGINAQLVYATSSLLAYRLPPYVTPLSQSTYSLTNEKLLTGTFFGDIATQVPSAFDSKLSTYYYSNAATCYIGVDFGPYLTANISKIRYYPQQSWKSAGPYMIGSTFYGSNDNQTWTLLYTVDNTVHTGYNIWRPATPLTTSYRYIKFQHNTTSNCQLANLEFYGILYQGNPDSLTSNAVDVHFTDGFHATTWSSIVNYTIAATPVITSITPKNGNPIGGYNITIAGTGFSIAADQTNITIDGIPCAVQGSPTTTQIKCLVGKRSSLPVANTFDVYIGQNRPAIQCRNFTYVSRWSDINTWGGDLPPMTGDSVYVPPGMILYVDQSTPNLQTIVVEGSIVFADEDDYQIQTGSLIVNFGVFQAGTQEYPYQHKLTFLLHGSYYDKQLPGFGNKVIGCHCCKFDMYGQPRIPTWTELALGNSINPGDTTLTVAVPVDWKVGQSIAVASSSYDHNQGEQRTIKSIDATKTIITVTQAFNYKHISNIQSFGTNGDTARLIAEVALLTRNIVVTGDSYSASTQYGAHVMMHGPSTGGLVGHIAYTEVTQCGQPLIVGRYCLHFHMNGDVSESYVIGNAVHHSHARILTLHGIHYLTVQKNVGYRVQGHNFFLEDGIETYNVIQDNLAISTIQVWTMLQTDISCASYWITNPLNTVRRNHAAGSDFYGFWYQIKPNPDGLSATNDICPTGLPIGQSSNNVAHSNVRFGLRVFKLFSSTNPCMNPRDDRLVDPWSNNPSIQNTFANYTLYLNNVSGILGQQIGNTIFSNCTIVDSGQSGVEFQITNFSKQFVVLQNAIIVAQSTTFNPSTSSLLGVRGIITPRTDGFMANDIRFYKFPTGTIVFEACSNCDNPDCRVTTGKSTYFSKIKYSEINGSYIHWKYVRRQIYYDLDGSLTYPFDNVTRANATVTPYYPHNDIPNVCKNSSTSVTLWDTSHVCTEVVVRSIAFGNAIPTSWFQNGDMKILRLATPYDNISTVKTGYSDIWVLKAMRDKPQAWAAPFVVGYIYDLWWLSGIDFTHLAIIGSQYYNESDLGIILRFNYTAHRQLFDITNMVSGKLTLPMLSSSSQIPDPTKCNNGDYYVNTTSQYLYVCVSGKNRTVANYIELNGITCRYLCPKPGNQFIKQNFVRMWSNASQWPNQVLPNPGDNVTINGNWTILVDMDPAPINNLTIDGDVIIGNRNTNISAHFIYIRSGSLTAGTASTPFAYNFTITFLGNHSDFTYSIDPTVNANKYMVVTGQLNLYGNTPSSVFTKLSATAFAGDTSIIVDDATDWVVGNTIGIAPSFSDSTQVQQVQITAINGNNITISPALSFTHYGGATPTINNSYGILDMRAGVAVLDRNIRMVSGTDAGWGFRVLIYAFYDQDTNITWRGNAIIQGVQFVQGGQYDTDYAALVFQNLVVGTGQSLVTGCSLHDCGGYCMKLINSYNVTIDTNSFFIGRKFIVYAESMYNYLFNNNFMAGALARVSMVNAPMGDDVSCYNQYMQLDFSTDNNTVTNNLCQGSAVQGFVFPHTPCQYLGKAGGVNAISSFINNTAGSSVVGFGFNQMSGYSCLGGQGMKGYGNKIGFIQNPFGPTSMIFQNIMMADSGRGGGLKLGNIHQSNNTAFLKNTWISALARPDCTYCYGDTSDKTSCKWNIGLRMFITTQNGQHYPQKFGPPIDTICKSQSFDSKAFLYNVTFDNFNQQYPGLSQCGSNFVFRSHPTAHDFTGSHHLTLTYCNNCDGNSYGYFDPPNPAFLGWLGGCGLILCTGNNNYLMHDHDGSFLGYNGIIVANNSVVGGNTTGCTANPIMNGHICAREDLAVLNYQSIAADFKTRIMWPVNMTYDGGNWTTTTNGFRQWEWSNKQPMNLRLARFVTVFQLYKVYNMTFASQPPSDMLFQIQKRQLPGDNTQWVVIKIYYPIPNLIQVMNNGKIIPPILATSNQSITNRVNTCGSNKYFYQNSTIHFVVTGDALCQPRVTVTSSVQITARLQMDMKSFFDSDGVTRFIDRICAFLNINDTSRLKVVGVYSGSTIIESQLVDNSQLNLDSNGIAPEVNQTLVYANLKALADTLTSGANNGSLSLGNLGSILSLSVTVNVVNTDGTLYTIPSISKNLTQITIIIAVVVSVLSAIIIGLTIYLVIRKLRSRQKINPQDPSERSEIQQIEFSKRAENPILFEMGEKEHKQANIKSIE